MGSNPTPSIKECLVTYKLEYTLFENDFKDAVTFVILLNNSVLINCTRPNKLRMFGWNVYHTCKTLVGTVSTRYSIVINHPSTLRQDLIREQIRLAFILDGRVYE